MKPFRRRHLQIHTHAVRQITGSLYQQRIRSRYGFHMDIPLKPMQRPQPVHRLADQLHRIIGAVQYPGTQEQTFYIVTPVKFHRQITHLVRRKGGTRHVVRPSVDTVPAVIDALVGKQYLQ